MPVKPLQNAPERRQMALVPAPARSCLSTTRKLRQTLGWTGRDLQSGRFRLQVYRFLTDSIPAISSTIWTWVRLTAAPGRFQIRGSDSATAKQAAERLDRLTTRLGVSPSGQPVSLSVLLTELLVHLFRDGCFGGFLTVQPDGSSVDRFVPVDPSQFDLETSSGEPRLYLQQGDKKIRLDRPDFFLVPFNGSGTEPFGRSILQAVPFVAYIEQQLVDDMRRSSHNSGFHRLHVSVTPPERIAGESDTAYTDRINDYFDSTVKMIRTCEVDDNPVTWDNIRIDYIGPDKSRDVANSWFMSHRAMIEDICAGTNLAPYLLGYSYGATTTWSNFKFDVVMRQVRAIQNELSSFLEWIGNVELALANLDYTCRFEFDNAFAYQAKEEASIQSSKVDNLLKLFSAGLIDKQIAADRAGQLL